MDIVECRARLRDFLRHQRAMLSRLRRVAAERQCDSDVSRKFWRLRFLTAAHPQSIPRPSRMAERRHYYRPQPVQRGSG
jgi:hypothetical protein